MLQTKYDLLELSNWQKFLVCDTIVSSPTYQKEGVAFFRNEKIVNIHYDFDIRRKPVAFKNSDDYANERLIFYGFICKVTVEKSDYPKLLYVTQTYDDKKSVYVLRPENEMGIFLHKYFKNVPVLMNVRDLATAKHEIVEPKRRLKNRKPLLHPKPPLPRPNPQAPLL